MEGQDLIRPALRRATVPQGEGMGAVHYNFQQLRYRAVPNGVTIIDPVRHEFAAGHARQITIFRCNDNERDAPRSEYHPVGARIDISGKKVIMEKDMKKGVTE